MRTLDDLFTPEQQHLYLTNAAFKAGADQAIEMLRYTLTGLAVWAEKENAALQLMLAALKEAPPMWNYRTGKPW